MIAISGLLVLAAIGLLVVGLVLSNFVLVYASIGVSLVSAVCWVVGVYLGRDQLRSRGGTSKRSAKAGAKGRSGKAGAKSGARKRPAAASKASGQKARRPDGRQRTAAKGGGSTTAIAPPDDATVVVVPGRLRYHLPNCRQVGGRDPEEIELAEARAQGYVACTACRPDSVLAARADRAAADDSEADEETDTDGAAADDGDAGTDEKTEADDAGPDGESKSVESESGDEPESVAGDARVATVTGQRRYHLESCQVVHDAREDETEVRDLTVAQARDEGLTPCTVCGAPAS